MTRLPELLKNDPIAEAILEIKFLHEQSDSFPESVLTSITKQPELQDFRISRTPIADIPASFRSSDPNLKYAPMIEMIGEGDCRVVKVGTHAVSFHRMNVYPGWKVFFGELEQSVGYLFKAFNNLKVVRLGLRYVNLFDSEKHFLKAVSELNISAEIADCSLDPPYNINYLRSLDDLHTAMVKVASREFLQPEPNANISAAVDVDVFTPLNCTPLDNAGEVVKWIDAAHRYEKQLFFELFTKTMKEKLVAK
jgi:uncharacterized protein (TIGR04255 family)